MHASAQTEVQRNEGECLDKATGQYNEPAKRQIRQFQVQIAGKLPTSFTCRSHYPLMCSFDLNVEICVRELRCINVILPLPGQKNLADYASLKRSSFERAEQRGAALFPLEEVETD